MKRDSARCILTDMSEDRLINDRFVEELDHVKRWCRKSSTNIIDMASLVGNTHVNIGASEECCSMKYERVKNLGIIPWTSPRTGDTWVSLMRTNSKGLMASHLYFWNTFGSAGFMHRVCIHSPSGLCYDCISCITSHAMYRYRDRMGFSEMSPFETILWLQSKVDSMAVKADMHNGKWQINMICEDGAFMSTFVNPSTEKLAYPVVRFKTYLPFKSMSKSKADEMKKYLDDVRSYQGISL